MRGPMINELKIISPMGTGSGAYVIHRLLQRYITGYRVVSHHPNWEFVPFALPFVAKIKNANLIHTVPDYAWFFHRKSVPMIISFQNYILDDWMRPYNSWLQKIHYTTDLKLWTRLAVKNAKRITAVSEFTGHLSKHELNISSPIRVIYNGVDTNRFTPLPFNTLNKKPIKVFFSGNLTRRKGAQWIPEIAKRVEKNVCIYYTQGLRTRNALPPLSNLKPVGSVPYEYMPERYRQMDILLLPTVREGFSVAVLEAMACGIPVVASMCSSLPEQINHGRGGFLCKIGDIKDFAEKINILADSPNLRREMGEYNRSKVENNFTLDKMVSEYRNLFNEVLNDEV